VRAPDEASDVLRLRCADRTIAYRLLGAGPELVLLLHGRPQTGLCWRSVAPALADRYTVAVPDLRDYADSSPHQFA